MHIKIGNVVIENQVVLAPMAGVTDAPFRKIVKAFHPGLVSGEMVSAAALHFNSKQTHDIIKVYPEEKPVSIQIFGSEPEIMAEAAQIIEANGADIIDINMGCPVPKIVKNFEGAALMNDLPLAEKIIQAVVKSVKVPVTVKFRLGWDRDHIVAPQLAQIAEGCGAAAVAVHGRTRDQFYQGKSDWDGIKEVKKTVRIPVIGNGDVDSPVAAQAMIGHTGCDGVMIGQAAMGKPWIFNQVVQYLETGLLLPEPGLAERFGIIHKHLQLQVASIGEERAIKEMRKHLAWYFKGLPGSARMREEINYLTTLAEVQSVIGEYANSLQEFC